MRIFKLIGAVVGLLIAAAIVVPLAVLAGLFVWLKLTEEADEEALELEQEAGVLGVEPLNTADEPGHEPGSIDSRGRIVARPSAMVARSIRKSFDPRPTEGRLTGVPPADLRPSFPPSGVPLSVLVDYDGTISRTDIGDLLLVRHVTDRETLERLDAAYDAGTMGSRELLRWDMDVLPDPPDGLRAEAQAVDQDPGFAALVGVVRRRGGAVEIVSDGLAFYIEANVRRLGLDDVPVATNRNQLRGGGAGMDFPYGHAACFVCGTCKRERVRVHQAAGRVVAFVGDGPSDRYAVYHADITFATGRLLDWCQDNDQPAIAWTELREVADWIDLALTDGRLPTRSDDVPAWRSAAVRRDDRDRPPFICGPEVWGEGRTVPPGR